MYLNSCMYVVIKILIIIIIIITIRVVPIEDFTDMPITGIVSRIEADR